MKHNNLSEKIKYGKLFKKTDIIFLAVLITVIAAAFFAVIPKDKGSYAEIYSGSRLVKVMYLNIDSEYTFNFDQDHKNVITVKDGKIFITNSDCNDKICMHFAPADKTGSTIICLPHKLYIVVKGTKDDIDGVV